MAFFSMMALKATQGETPYKYLGVISDDDSENKGYLAYFTDQLLSTNAKFAVENAHSGLVHIRSCRTNKYWVRSSTEGYWIMAKASEAQDDPSAWNCTLFRIDLIDDDNKATFYHVQSGTTLRIPNDNSDRKMFLSIDPSATTQAVSTAIDYDSVQLLPKYIALKGDNGFFYDIEKGFKCDDIAEERVALETMVTKDGYIRLKVKCLEPDYYVLGWAIAMLSGIIVICSSDDDDVNDDKKLFAVVKVRDDVVALRNLGTGKYCCRDPSSNLMFDSVTTIVKEAQFQVVETVFSRKVQVLDFDLDNSRIYNLRPIASPTHIYDNDTNEEADGSMDLRISTTNTTTWNNSVNLKYGVETSFQTGVPVIAEGKITVSFEASYEHQWGGSVEETVEVGDTYHFNVPPMKRVVGRGMATKGNCDVPFSYVQVDHLTNGKTVSTTLSDGVFTGVNAYNFYHDVHDEELPPEYHQIKAASDDTN